MDNRPIGVFDSGLGGLSAVKELKRILPNESILYFGDTGRVPYGTKSRETLLKFSAQDMNFLIKNNVKVVVAACGTVSSTALQLGKSLPVPYFDVISPTAAAAAAATKNGKVGVIGTSTTIKSGSFERALKEINPDLEIFTQPCPLFVPLVENGYVTDGDAVTLMVAQRYLESVCARDIDTMILGCTHFPLIKKAIGTVVGEKVRLIDSGKETARYIAESLRKADLLCEENHRPTYSYYVSDSIDGFTSVAELFLGGDIDGEVQRIDIEKF